MPANTSKLTYVGKDFSEIRDQLVAAIPSLTDRWTDLNESDVGMTLLELWASIGDMLGFYLDQSVLETFLPTVRQRKNLINLVKLIGYRLEHVVSSTTVLEFSLESAHDYRIEIPKYTKIATNQVAGETPIYFVTTSLAVIPTGETSIQVGGKQGILTSEKFRTDGTENQRFRLDETEVDVSSIEVVINNIVWAQVESFVNAESSDRVYMVEVDADNNVEVVFGDGFFGSAPPLSSVDNLTVNYLVSEGGSGNVGTNTVTTLLSTLTDINGTNISASVTNVQAATGGANQESIEHAKRQAPAELSALFRAMTKADHIALIEGYPGVGKATAWGEQDENPPDYNLYNWVMISIAPEGVSRVSLIDDVTLGAPSDQLKKDVLDFLESRKCITTRMKMIDPVYIPIDIEVTVYYSSGYLPSTVKANIEQAVTDFFSFETTSFGKEVRKSNIVRIIDGIEGVSHISLTKLNTDGSEVDVEEVVVLNKYELAFLRDLIISMEKATDTPPRAGLYPCPADNISPGD